MKVKGVVILTIVDFVKTLNRANYHIWLENLPDESKKIFTNNIIEKNYYDVDYAIVEPLKTAAELFNNKNYKDTAINSGIFTIDKYISNFHRFYIKLFTTEIILKGGLKRFSKLFDEGKIILNKTHSKSYKITVMNISEIDQIIEYRFMGILKKLIELKNHKNVNIEIIKSLNNGDKYTEYELTFD